MLDVFKGRPDIHAVATGRGFKPVHRPITHSDIFAHLNHQEEIGNCRGFYLMDEDSKVQVSCLDFDDHSGDNPNWKLQAEQYYYLLTSCGIVPLVEVSQSGSGCHLWLILDEPTPAQLVRQFWKALADHLQAPLPEVYPKQDRLSGKGLGNLVRFPQWGKSYFALAEEDWREDPDWRSSFVRASLDELRATAWGLAKAILKEDTPQASQGVSPLVKSLIEGNTLLAKRWAGDTTGIVEADKSRSAVAQSIALHLVRSYVPEHEVREAIREWSSIHYDEPKPMDWVDRTVQSAYKHIHSDKAESGSLRPTTLHDASLRFLEDLSSGKVVHIKSGIEDLDKSIDGIAPGEMSVLAARPSQGKSALAIQWAIEACKQGHPCLMLSEEMSKSEVGRRALMRVFPGNEDIWREGSKEAHTRLRDAFKGIAPMYVVDAIGTIERAIELIDQYTRAHGVQVVIVDYVQLLGSRKYTGALERVSEISRQLKSAAKRHNAAVVALAQMNRAVEMREGAAPQMSDLRDSGQIEQDADLICFLKWPYRAGSSQRETHYEIHIAKRRNGPIRKKEVVVHFDPRSQVFR